MKNSIEKVYKKTSKLCKKLEHLLNIKNDIV